MDLIFCFFFFSSFLVEQFETCLVIAIVDARRSHLRCVFNECNLRPEAVPNRKLHMCERTCWQFTVRYENICQFRKKTSFPISQTKKKTTCNDTWDEKTSVNRITAKIHSFVIFTDDIVPFFSIMAGVHEPFRIFVTALLTRIQQDLNDSPESISVELTVIVELPLDKHPDGIYRTVFFFSYFFLQFYYKLNEFEKYQI